MPEIVAFGRVCRSFHKITQLPSSWPTIDLRDVIVDPETSVSVIDRFHHSFPYTLQRAASIYLGPEMTVLTLMSKLSTTTTTNIGLRHLEIDRLLDRNMRKLAATVPHLLTLNVHVYNGNVADILDAFPCMEHLRVGRTDGSHQTNVCIPARFLTFDVTSIGTASVSWTTDVHFRPRLRELRLESRTYSIATQAPDLLALTDLQTLVLTDVDPERMTQALLLSSSLTHLGRIHVVTTPGFDDDDESNAASSTRIHSAMQRLCLSNATLFDHAGTPLWDTHGGSNNDGFFFLKKKKKNIFR